MTEASIPTEKTAKCGNPGMAKTAGLRVVCRAMSKVFRPRAPIDGYQTGTTFLRKRTSPTSRRFLVKARRFQDLPVTLPNPPWPQLHGFKAPERLLHFSDRSQFYNLAIRVVRLVGRCVVIRC